MQAKGSKGPLLQRAIQELLSALPDDEVISLFTNTKTFKNVNKKDIRNDLLQLEYTSNQTPYKAAYLKAKQLMGNTPETCLLYTSPSPRDLSTSRMPSSA